MQNQFLSSPLLISRQHIQQKIEVSNQKDQLIKGLQIKNTKLQRQIIKIQQILAENASTLNTIQTKKQRKSIMNKNDDNPAALNQQLSNAYKKIKMYEYEIEKINGTADHGQISMVHKAKQLETIIKQKQFMANKLKGLYLAQQKVITDNTRKLNNNSYQTQVEKKIKNLTDQVKFLREKAKDIEAKGQMKQNNMKKQYQFVKKLELQLVEAGIANQELEDIKNRVIRRVQNISQSHVTHFTKSASLNKSKIEAIALNEEIIEDRTRDTYINICNEIKLLQKMQYDYETQIQDSQEQKNEAMNKNAQSRNRLLEIQSNIEKVQKQIMMLKGQIIPSNMKPLKPLRSLSSSHHSSNKDKIPVKNVSIGKNNKTLNHILKFDEVGMVSDKGQRFTDRNILGKNKLNAKITRLLVYLDPKQGVICGLQATYGNKKGGQYIKKDRDAKLPQYKQQIIECGDGEWIRGISGTLNETDKLQSLYIITSKGQAKRFGEAKNVKKSFNFDINQQQMPVCIFGALYIRKQIGKLESSIVEHFGIEINKQSSKPKEALYDIQ